MTSTFTDHDMRNQVAAALTPHSDSYDVPAIVDALQAEFGTVNIDTIPQGRLYEIVGEHDVTQQDSYDVNERHEENLRRWNANHA